MSTILEGVTHYDTVALRVSLLALSHCSLRLWPLSPTVRVSTMTPQPPQFTVDPEMLKAGFVWLHEEELTEMRRAIEDMHAEWEMEHALRLRYEAVVEAAREYAACFNAPRLENDHRTLGAKAATAFSKLRTALAALDRQ